MAAAILLVKKSDHRAQATVEFDLTALPLHESSTRVRPRLLGLGKPNPFYVFAGGIFSFWKAFPVPEALRESHDPEKWCTPKAWGYAEVVASPATGGASIPTGSLLFGWWPISSGEHDLALEPMAGSPGHFTETSPSREGIMSLYNHYYIAEGTPSPWMVAVFLSWGVSHLLCEYAFPPELSRLDQAIHPGGDGVGAWDVGDADIRSTLVVGLSASSKSGRSFSWNLRQDRSNRPLAYLEVSSSGQTRGESDFETRGATYEELLGEETLQWVNGVGPKKILVVDFGARGDLAARLLEVFSARVGGEVAFTFVGVGANPEIMRDENLAEKMAKGQVLRKIQGNHSGIQETAERAVGAVLVLERWTSAFQEWKRSEDARGYAVVEGRGLDGSAGIAEGWRELYGGEKAQTDTAYAFWL